MLAAVAPMPKHILIIDGHPDPESHKFVHALAESVRPRCELMCVDVVER